MQTLVYGSRSYEKDALLRANRKRHDLQFTDARLDRLTAAMARGYPAICAFVDDDLSAPVLENLSDGGTKLVALRATGFNNVDLRAAEEAGITVMRVAHYSPYSVAEFAVGMALSLNRKIHRAFHRVRDGNFLLDGFMGFDFHGKTVGVVGTGRIGTVFAGIMHGFGCALLGFDPRGNDECRSMGMNYVSLEELLVQSDIISLHCPLTPETYHLINRDTLKLLKKESVLINTSRGALVDAGALIDYLKKCPSCQVGLDVYEEESDLYYRDLSDRIISDDIVARLMTLPNVLITGHQAFFTYEALNEIAETTIQNISDFAAGKSNKNILKPGQVLASTLR